MGRLQARESRIILGAAVIDDVLGLLILAVVSGAIKAAHAGTTLSLAEVTLITVKAVVFLLGAVAAGRYVAPRLFQRAGKWEVRGLLMAWAAALVGLAPIVGAFAAGLALDEAHYAPFRDRGKRALRN